MDPLSLIINAAINGAISGVKDTVSQAVKDVYIGFKAAIAARSSNVRLDKLERSPSNRRLQCAIRSDIERESTALLSDPEISALAQKLIELCSQEGSTIEPDTSALERSRSLQKAIETESEKFSESIRAHASNIDRIIDKLTKDQFRVIRMLRHQRRVRISGCAGSGKTLVAAEKAIRLADGGNRTLLLCHSPLLALYLKQLCAGHAIEIADYQGWLRNLRSIKGEDFTNGLWTNYDEPTSEILDAALDEIIQGDVSYDAIIVALTR